MSTVTVDTGNGYTNDLADIEDLRRKTLSIPIS